VTGDEGYEERFHQLVADWRAVEAPGRVIAETRFAELKAEAQAIRSVGRWVSGPTDILTILRRHRDELFHSRLLGWLLTPTGRHGLGDRFLKAFLDEVFPGEGLADEVGAVTVELERAAAGESGATGEILQSRADLVIRLDGLVVIVENKLDAGEQPSQCERLYWSWAHDSVEARWVFLTPGGKDPESVFSNEAKDAFRSASYMQVQRALASALIPTPAASAEGGRASALQYLATLTAQFKP
jgi:hypothetical protein